MSESDPSSPSAKPQSRSGGEWLWLCLAFLIAAGLFAAVFFLPIRDEIMPLPGGAAPSQERTNEIEHRLQALEARVSTLETQEPNTPAPVSLLHEQPPHAAPATDDLAHVQSDLAQLAATVGGLQDQVKQTGASVHAVTQTALAKMIAFMQLRDAAASNHGFATELEAMRAAAKDAPNLKEPLDKLAPYADKGAPGLALLREELTEQTSAVEVATAKAGAQNWWERILAELRGLVLIRSLNSSEAQDGALQAMKSALAGDDVAAALAAMKTLSPEAQQTLTEWQKQAEARLAIIESLQAIANRLTADAEAAPAPPVQGAP
jgi:hypothetical protein